MNREDWNRRYSGSELIWTAEPNRFLAEEISTLPAGRALDLACGEGRNAVWLASRGWRVDAVDFSAVALQKARRLAEAREIDVNWVEEDVESYAPASGGHDLVVLIYLHLPWDRMRGVLGRAAEAVAPGGTFLLVGHDRSNIEQGHGGPQRAEVLYTAEQIANALSGLDVEEAAHRLRPVDTADGPKTAIDCLVRATRPIQLD